ncbi:hypothetical protein FACS1894161_5550 [Spirochaetia bacterium]|nr:hypothetical protein FACS1894161_5550 [Spirochaetia bacterium]
MGIADRLAEVLKSYLNNGNGAATPRPGKSGPSADPDLRAAWEELDEFLGTGTKRGEAFAKKTSHTEAEWRTEARGGGAQKRPPEALRPDYAELGLPFGAPLEECKSAYKALLKIHHPDRHAGHEGNLRKATEKSARINAAFDRIEHWAYS